MQTYGSDFVDGYERLKLLGRYVLFKWFKLRSYFLYHSECYVRGGCAVVWLARDKSNIEGSQLLAVKQTRKGKDQKHRGDMDAAKREVAFLSILFGEPGMWKCVGHSFHDAIFVDLRMFTY
jgi:hypothetical protein